MARRTRIGSLTFTFGLLAALGCGGPETPSAAASPQTSAATTPPAAPVVPATASDPDQRLREADRESGNWLLNGRTYMDQHFSPLDQIREENVGQLTQVWSFATGLTRGHESTPLAVDGMLYFTGSWSVVFALDARTGKQIWKYDPLVPREFGARACCDVVNRGVAYYADRIYAATLDGRLTALDAKTGALVWQTLTVDNSKPYTVTGAPRIVEGKIIIGNGGAEFGVRGYVSAYDAQNGKLVWRTYTVPGDPSQPFESPALERAAATWKGEWWKIGGGGTAWDSMVYDPELHLLYVGTGNGSPWTRHIRSPGGGDNLYLSSILALKPDTGEQVWHYQTTPGDNWDFTATQHIVLADLEIGGAKRKVLMQAPKNGFFYVIDRATGELISAEKYVSVSWASHVDMKTGKPVEVEGQDYGKGLALVQPTALGGHNWQPMSFNPKTGLVYIPAQDILGVYRLDPNYKFRPNDYNTGIDFNAFKDISADAVSGQLVAWDPVHQREVWRQPYALPWNGGTLTTAGNLVFQGTADGHLVAYRATDGKKLWEVSASTGIMAAPMTWELDGRQYVTVLAGWGGAFGLVGGNAAAGAKPGSGGELLTFALRAAPPPNISELVESSLAASDKDPDGERLYHSFCARCHGAAAVGNGLIPDLRETSPDLDAAFADVVVRGAYRGKGMPGFEGSLTDQDAARIQTYLHSRRSAAAH